MDVAEEVFCADSDALIDILEALDGAPDPMRWAAATYGIDGLIRAQHPNLDEAHAFARRCRDAFSAGAHKDAATRRRLAGIFRERRQALMALWSRAGDDRLVHAVRSAFDSRAQRVAPLVAKLRSLEKKGMLRQPLGRLLGSMVHMHFNRMSRSHDRFAELAAYDSLCLVYQGLAARTAAETGVVSTVA